MGLLVVDASAIAALVFVEPEADDLAARLRGEGLVAPQLLAYEVANVAAVKLRRRLVSRQAAAEALALFGRLDVRLHPVTASDAFDTAAGTGLTAYDGAYLWLARALGAPLVTLDRRVAAASREPG